jgi:DNA repair protein RadD
MNAPLFPAAVATEPRTLRLYQETAIDLLRESLRTGHRRPILQLPTGAGKTRIAAEIVLGSLSKERRAIFVVPRISLIEQTVAAFEREGVWNIGVIQGQHFRTNLDAPVQIASAQTLARREIPPADVVIVDECHLQFKSITEWIAVLEWQAVPFIGLSATPWAKGLGKSYDDLLMPVSIQELIDEAYLSPFRVFAPPGPDLSAVRTVAGDFHEADLSDVCDTKEIVADIVKTWFEKGENRPTLCYGIDRKHAQHLQERFIEAGIRTEYIDCDTPLFEQCSDARHWYRPRRQMYNRRPANAVAYPIRPDYRARAAAGRGQGSPGRLGSRRQSPTARSRHRYRDRRSRQRRRRTEL